MLLVGEFDVGEEFLKVGDFLLHCQDKTVIKLNLLFFVIGHKVWGDVTTIKF